MFTGLVEETGTVCLLESRGETARLGILASCPCRNDAVGDSISVSGCCLTVVAVEGNRLEFVVGRETLLRTAFAALKTGSTVNLERALRAGDRMGGHSVSGHVDAAIRILERIDQGDWSTFWFSLPAELAPHVVDQGSVTIDGISLTVVRVHPDRFSVMVIPHTLTATTLGGKKAGDPVNLETDILAKYIDRQLQLRGLAGKRDPA